MLFCQSCYRTRSVESLRQVGIQRGVTRVEPVYIDFYLICPTTRCAVRLVEQERVAYIRNPFKTVFYTVPFGTMKRDVNLTVSSDGGSGGDDDAYETSIPGDVMDRRLIRQAT